MGRLRWKCILFLLRHSSFYQYFHNSINKIIRRKHSQKVFCIGSVKTGTTSLYKAMQILGYRTVRVFDNGRLLSKEWNTYLSRIKKLEKEQWQSYIDRIQKSEYDAFIDFPFWYDDLYQILDQSIPNSKFILTIRDSKEYMKSYTNYFQGSPWEIKNSDEWNQKHNEFQNHIKNVKDYFSSDPSRLLVLDLFLGQGWKELCGFLDKPIPKRRFPHKNKGKYKKEKPS